jgi:tRNA (mo5U34)-methyltransferase
VDRNELLERIAGINWYHSIDLGDGVVTPGGAPFIPESAFPDVAGKRVLDIGAWDGYYSFRAERLGAAEVTSLDHYAWGIDWPARLEYWNDCRARGVFPDHSIDEQEFWRPELPGRRGYELAHEVLGSQARPVCVDFMKADLDQLGTFDVVLYLGVLYHMMEPLTALQRVRRVTREVALIETEAAWLPAAGSLPALTFYAGDELAGDFGNWYAPNEAALHAMCRAAGFSRVTTCVAREPGRGHRRRATTYRLAVQAFI